MKSDCSEDNSDDIQDLLSVLSSSTKGKEEGQTSRYVCHTSSIPLPTIFRNLGGPGRKENKHSLYCSRDCCMFKRGQPHYILENCPCIIDKLPEVCFLEVCNQKERNTFIDTESSFDINSVAFCPDHCGILDNKYTLPIREEIGASGWFYLNEDQLRKAISLLQWAKPKFIKRFKIHEYLELVFKKPINRAKTLIKHTLHTMASVTIKLLLTCGDALITEDIHEIQAMYFKEILGAYLDEPVFLDGIAINTENAYSELKKICKLCKSSFHNQGSRELRTQWLEFEAKYDSNKRFIEILRRKFLYEVEYMYSSMGEDFTLSIKWFQLNVTITQTRNMGFLPDSLAVPKQYEFRSTISRPRLPQENAALIYNSVLKELEEGKVPKFLLDTRSPKTEEMEKFYKEVLSSIDFVLKPSASLDYKVSQGGKLEDARVLLKTFEDNDWKIPIRDLSTNEIIEYFKVERDISNPIISKPLFWISYQLTINDLVRRKLWDPKHYVKFLLKEEKKEFHLEVFDASIVHIQEPSKQRNLTKSTGVLAWLLTPPGKMLAKILGSLKEHKIGLLGASDSWNHLNRLSAKSEESFFLYDEKTLKINRNIVHFFSDWTESTDFIQKGVGLPALQGLMTYCGFPTAYRKIIELSLLVPQPVTEVICFSRASEEDELETTKIKWKGFINEGFMMGNPVTKIILHLMHVVELNIAKRWLMRDYNAEFGHQPNYKINFLQMPFRGDIQREPFIVRP